MSDVTRILEAVDAGDEHAADRLLEAVYDELRRLAQARLARERPGQTLQPTALVHEAYLRLVGGGKRGWDGRGHFFAAAAEAMRRILIDNARRKGRLRHGGGRQRVELAAADAELSSAAAGLPAADLDLLALDEALGRLDVEDPKKAELVKLRYFAGLTLPDAAEVLGISPGTADRWWAFARAWLYEEMTRESGNPRSGNP